MINLQLLKQIRSGLGKEAYAPPTQDPAAAGGGMPFTDPAMAAGGGMPPGGAPMDPAMMAMAGGGMPPVDPMAMMAMAGGAGGMPPMPGGVDPTTGLPPMDPSMMPGAGAAPMDPSMMGMPPTPEAPETVQVSLDDLRAIFAEVAGGGGEDGAEKPIGDKTDTGSRLDNLEQMMVMLLEQFGMGPEGEMAGMPAEAPPAGMEGMLPPQAAPGVAAGPEALPEDFSLMEPPTEVPQTPEKQATARERVMSEVVLRLRQALQA